MFVCAAAVAMCRCNAVRLDACDATLDRLSTLLLSSHAISSYLISLHLITSLLISSLLTQLERMKAIMTACWSADPKKRPTMDEVVELLGESCAGERSSDANLAVTRTHWKRVASNCQVM